MSGPPWRAPVPFRGGSGGHETEQFDCGEPSLNRWLRTSAGQGERRDATRTYVVVDRDEQVVGYYAFAVTEIEFSDATTDVRKGLSRRFPIPAARLVRLAVDRRHQGSGLGAGLLLDAFARALRAAEQVGMRAVVVDAIDDDAAAFYRRFGLRGLDERAGTLMATVSHIRAAVERASPADATEGDEGDDEVGPHDLHEDENALWYERFVVLCACGLRPRVRPFGIVVGTGDVLVELRDLAGQADSGVVRVASVRAEGGKPTAIRDLVMPTVGEVVEAVEDLSDDAAPETPPSAVTERAAHLGVEAVRLGMAGIAYRPEIEALGRVGFDAYVDATSDELRLRADVSQDLVVDISVEDWPLGPTGPGAGAWVVMFESSGRLIAEFDVHRIGPRDGDAERLATAVRDALRQILRGGHILMGRLDDVTGRVDPGVVD